MTSRRRLLLAVVAVALLAALAVLVLPSPVAAVAVAVAVLLASWLAASPSGGAPGLPPEGLAAAPPAAAPEPHAEADAALQALLAPLPDGVVILDDDLTVVAANPALAALVDHPLGAMIGASLIRATRDYELVAVARERPAEAREARLSGAAEVRLSAAPISPPVAGGRGTLAVIVEDVTALRAAQRARSDLVANLSHELRTPLAGARAVTETLTTAVEDPAERKHFLGLLSEEIERMSGLVERMLRLAQLESELEPIELEPLAPGALLQAAATRVAPVARRLGMRVEVEEAAAPPVDGNRERVGEVLASLLDNALRHSPDGGRVVLAALPENGEVRFEVRDEGPGILPNERERVFERFYIGDAARDSSAGTGLGLAIARQLVQQQGGRIWVADRSPGATLCFTLTRAEAAGTGEP